MDAPGTDPKGSREPPNDGLDKLDRLGTSWLVRRYDDAREHVMRLVVIGLAAALDVSVLTMPHLIGDDTGTIIAGLLFVVNGAALVAFSNLRTAKNEITGAHIENLDLHIRELERAVASLGSEIGAMREKPAAGEPDT